MALPRRTLLIVLGSIVALILLIVLCIPLFLNADAFRTRIETALTTSLGRKVTLGNLDLSVLTGSLVAENATIADDPAFSNQPFLQASKVKIGIEMIPLIFSREIHITGFAIDSPKINLLRAANGTWNYSTIGSAQQNTAANKESSTLIPNLTVGHVTITNGQLTVGTSARSRHPRPLRAAPTISSPSTRKTSPSRNPSPSPSRPIFPATEPSRSTATPAPSIRMMHPSLPSALTSKPNTSTRSPQASSTPPPASPAPSTPSTCRQHGTASSSTSPTFSSTRPNSPSFATTSPPPPRRHRPHPTATTCSAPSPPTTFR